MIYQPPLLTRYESWKLLKGNLYLATSESDMAERILWGLVIMMHVGCDITDHFLFHVLDPYIPDALNKLNGGVSVWETRESWDS